MGAAARIDRSHRVRLLFAFDLQREAILLVGGDKSEDWSGWYKTTFLSPTTASTSTRSA